MRRFVLFDSEIKLIENYDIDIVYSGNYKNLFDTKQFMAILDTHGIDSYKIVKQLHCRLYGMNENVSDWVLPINLKCLCFMKDYKPYIIDKRTHHEKIKDYAKELEQEDEKSDELFENDFENNNESIHNNIDFNEEDI